MDLGKSIITNFGCPFSCPYCLWKNNNLSSVFPKTSCKDTNWEKLRQFISSETRVSISGGGDPLFRFFENQDWWSTLFSLAKEYSLSLSVHTRYMSHASFNLFNKIVHSFDTMEELKQILLKRGKQQVRCAKVITPSTTEEEIERIIKLSDKTDIQLTFKQLFGAHDNGMFQFLKSKFGSTDSILWLDNGNHNIYFMPDNSIKTSFFKDENI